MAVLVLVGRLLTERKALQITKFLNRVTSYNINNLLKKIGGFRTGITVEVNPICIYNCRYFGQTEIDHKNGVEING